MSNNCTESNKPRTVHEVFDASCTSCTLPCDCPDASPSINFKATNVASAWFPDHKKFNMEPVWLFGVVTLEMDSALKRTHAFIQR